MGKSKKKGGFPDGWFDYTPMKTEIPGVRIVPMKCPLPSHRFDNPSKQEHKWSPEDIMLRVPNLGLVIDLTFKKPPYYDPDEFLDAGVEYEKILIAGHFIPNEDSVSKFCEIVKSFLMKNIRNDSVIGVHCTHGVNRTGYMICRYMVDRLRYQPQKALDEFATSRGQPMERENYRNAILKLGVRSDVALDVGSSDVAECKGSEEAAASPLKV